MIIVEGIGHVNIPVSQLDASIEFYQDVFDFELESKKATEALLTLDSFKIRLVQSPQAGVETGYPVLSFIMDVDDFTEAISELEEKNVKIVRGPESYENGESLTFSDPNQNLLEIYYEN